MKSLRCGATSEEVGRGGLGWKEAKERGDEGLGGGVGARGGNILG